MNARPNLVVVRAGKQSLHPKWLSSERNWDLLVSWYDDGDYQPVSDEKITYIKGGKGDGIYQTFKNFPDLLEAYQYFWLPDDDVEASCQTINRLFEIASCERLPVCQPALTHDSYFNEPHTLASHSFRLRYTSFVEVMVPCLSRQRLKRVLPYFHNHPALFGVGSVWTRLEKDNLFRAAIIDETRVRHTRPHGEFLLKTMKENGDDGSKKRQELMSAFGLSGKDRRFHCYGGKLTGGKRVGALTTRLLMVRDYIRHRNLWVERRAAKKLFKAFRQRLASISQLQRKSE